MIPLTRKEQAILGVLAAALLSGVVGGAVEYTRARRAAGASPVDLYRELLSALPDPGYLTAAAPARDPEIAAGARGRRTVYLTRPPLPGEEELEVSEDRWIFFPRDYSTTVNINRAGFAELVALPGIGPVAAGRILAYRWRYSGFARVKALKKVRGIGEKTLERLEGEIRLY